MDFGHKRAQDTMDREDLLDQFPSNGDLHILPNRAVRLQCDDAFEGIRWDLEGFLYPFQYVVRCSPLEYAVL